MGTLMGKTSRIPGLKSAKTRQYVLLAAILGAVYGGLYLIFAANEGSGGSAAVGKTAVDTRHINTPGQQVDPREVWIGQAGARVAEQQHRLNAQEQATADLAQKFRDLQEQIQNRPAPETYAVSAPAPSPAPTPAPTPAVPETPPSQAPSPPPVGAPASFPPASPGEAAAALSGLQRPAWLGGAGNLVNPGRAAAAAPPVRALGHYRVASATASTASAPGTAPATVVGGGSAPAAAESRKSSETFLPVGIVRAELISGIDAPTGGQAQSHPLPVMLRLTDLGVLPNHFRANLRECFLVGAAYGDIASERAYVRGELLSCIHTDGRVLEAPVHASVSDETGMLGIRGHVRTKQGQILSNAILAGVVSGIGSGLQLHSTETTVTPYGSSVSNPRSGKAFQAGLAGGFADAMDRLADYYISLAEKVFPVIEIQGRRKVDVMFTKGISLDVPLPDMSYGYFDED